MKQQLKKWIAVTSCMLFVFAGMAQQNKKLPGWLPENGYWVVESNLHSPKNHIVRFYTLGNVLIYSEKISGTKLNINQRKVKMKLKEVLELSVSAWKKNKYPEADKDYLAVLLK
jgi:hypothetical protein